MNSAVNRVTTPAGDPAWLITGYDNVKQLLADPRLGRSHPEPERAARFSASVLFGQAKYAETPEQHALMRKLLSRSFSARRMGELKPRVQSLLDALLDEMEREPRSVDIHDALSFPLPAHVICELLGVPLADQAKFRGWSADMINMTDHERSRQGLASLRAYMKDLLEHKRQHPAEDVLSDLASAQLRSEGAITVEHTFMIAAGLLFAGHQTTAAAITRGVMLFLTHPDQLASLNRDPDLVVSAVEEVLRFRYLPAKATPFLMGMPRYTQTDIDAGGVTIPAGDMVVLDLGDANFGADRFSGPETFDITRKPNPHVTFGHGPYSCLGAPLARIELQAVFRTLFKRFPTLRLAVPASELVLNSNGALEQLPVTW